MEKLSLSNRIRSSLPFVTLLCADEILSYTAQKSHQLAPDSAASLSMANRVAECSDKAMNAVKDTPCEVIHLAYEECLETKGIDACKAIERQLAECAVKHVLNKDKK